MNNYEDLRKLQVWFMTAMFAFLAIMLFTPDELTSIKLILLIAILVSVLINMILMRKMVKIDMKDYDVQREFVDRLLDSKSSNLYIDENTPDEFILSHIKDSILTGKYEYVIVLPIHKEGDSDE